MKYFISLILTLFIVFLSPHPVIAQNVGISADGSLPNGNAMLDIKASDKGLLIPRTSTVSRLLIPNTKGLMLYDTVTNSFWYNDGNAWQEMSNGSSALNGTKNFVAKFTGTATAGNSQIFDNGTNVGIGTIAPAARFQVVDSNVVFSAAGDVPATPHNSPIALGGRQMLWYADKAAFRVGYTLYDEWDSANIGKYSVGMGISNRATGLYSASIGEGSGASGESSFATGAYTNCTGDFAFTAGQYSTAKKAYGFAAGYYSEANGTSAIAMGYRAEADGNEAVALGTGSFANGNYSSAIGYEVAAYGNYSTASGYYTKANGTYSYAGGFQTNASGNNAFAIGNGTVASGVSSFASGALNQANGGASTAMGANSVANADYTFAAGENCHANAVYATAMGVNATANGAASFALCNNCTAGGSDSFVWGSNSNTTGASSIVLGINLFDGGHKGNAMLGDTDPWNAGSVGSGTDDQMICRFNNGYYFLTGGNTNRTGLIALHGDNSWSAISDSSKKEKIIPVDGEVLLQKISTFRLCTWNYKGQDPSAFRHYGPMAQDFHRAFGHDAVGTIGNDTLINQSDFLGVSFTAIQALEKRTEKIEAQQQEILHLEAENVRLAQQNNALQSQLTSMVRAMDALNQKVEAIVSNQASTGSLAHK